MNENLIKLRNVKVINRIDKKNNKERLRTYQYRNHLTNILHVVSTP